MAVSVSWNATFRNRVRLLAGIEQEELNNDTIHILANISSEELPYSKARCVPCNSLIIISFP